MVHCQSHLTICSHVCSCMLDLETCWVADARHREAWGWGRMAGSVWWWAVCGVRRAAGGMRRMLAEIMTPVEIIVWTLSLVRPPRQDLTMPHDHGVDNCSLRYCRKGRQLDLGESRSPTQIFRRNLLPASHRLWAYVCTFGPGLMVMVAMVMAMVMVSVMVIIVPEALRQVGWLRQH